MSDPDGPTPTFSIVNKPSWASFSASSGRLFGTPGAADAATYSSIGISVSDGYSSASLAAFTITVTAASNGSATVNWTSPTQNTDGSALTDLKGFKVRYGTSSSSLSNVLDIPNAGVTTAVVDNLSSGTWYFTVAAYNTAGGESVASQVMSKAVP